MGTSKFLARKLNEYQARSRLVGKTIRIFRSADSSSGAKVEQDIFVESIESGVDEDDCSTDVVYHINQGIRVWKGDDLEITIL